MTYKLCISIFCCLILSSPAIAQAKLSKSLQRSPYTYIYSISTEEARLYLEKGPKVVQESFFHTLVDSFAVQTTYQKQLGQGHFLFAYASGSDLVYEIHQVRPYGIKLLQNQADLNVLLHDTLGQAITGAQVWLSGKQVPFDAETQTYRLAKQKEGGLLEILYQGHTSFEAISHQDNGYRYPFSFRRLIYTRPIYYLWKPVRDVVQSIKYGPSGWIRSLVSVFDDTYQQSESVKYKGYVATTKPIYQPGDTVKYKAFILKKNGHPYRRQVWLEMQVNGKYKTLQKLNPYRPGAYTGELVLHDSLNLELDRHQYMSFTKPRKYGKTLMSQHFKYEDYELKETTYAARLEKEKLYQGQLNKVYLRGADANGLNLLDARMELVVLAGQVLQAEKPEVFVPDTLWVHRQPLDAEGETVVELPQHIFPEVSLVYRVEVVFLNSSNERVAKEVRGEYLHRQGRLELKLQQDSLRLEYLEGDTMLAKANAILTGFDNNGKALQEQEVRLPALLPLDPYISHYLLQWQGLKQKLDLHQQDDQLSLLTNRDTDSLYLAIQNPRKLPYWYFLYRKNRLVARGQGQERAWSSSLPLKGDAPYFVTLQYVWAGEAKDQEQNEPLLKQRLNLDLQAPKVVFPGQKASMTLAVTDYAGKPVPKVDLTAYAITSKFKENNLPNLTSFDKYKGRKKLKELRLSGLHGGSAKPLDWERWSQRMGLDSLAYYDFLYPERGLFQEYSLSRDSVTQFAPFVVDSGRVQPVHVIFVDEVPVYFSGTDVLPNYAFPADSGYHTIKLRTAEQLITLEKVYFKPQHKLTLSIDLDILTGASTPRTQALQNQERDMLNRYLFQVERNFNKDITYLKQGQVVQVLPQYAWQNRRQVPYSGYNEGRILAGPFLPDRMKFNRLGSITTTFTPEPDYLLTFEPELLKMREAKVLPDRVWLNKAPLPQEQIRLFDEAVNEADLQQQHEEQLRQYYLSRVYDKNTHHHPDEAPGLIMWQLDTAVYAQPEHVILYAAAGGMAQARIHSGFTQQLNKVEAGKYELVLLFREGQYLRRQVQVKPNGQTWLHFSKAEVKERDKFGRQIQEELERQVSKAKIVHPEPKEVSAVAPATPTYNQGSFSHAIYGRITDKEGNPIPGVTVVVKGTMVGTATDANGGYKLFVPSDGMLTIRFIGYNTQEVAVRGNSRIDVVLEGDMKQLEEVVVTGYAAVRKNSRYTPVVVEEEKPEFSNHLAGIAAGVVIGGNIRVRGVSAVAGAEPLLIVDGVPFSGKKSDLNPKDILKITTLSGQEATALYGAAGVAGVIIITTKRGGGGMAFGEATGEQAAGSGIRSNFSDYAFWQPRLVTDKAGKATFEVVFPGDVTSWNTQVLGMDYKKRSGMLRSSIRSFKAVMGTLSLPRFLVEGDKAQVVGKALNYLPDSTRIRTRFEVGGEVTRTQELTLSRSLTDTLTITAPIVAPDSVEVLYALQQPNGFEDGERRHVKVYPRGVAETNGLFLQLPRDTTFTLDFDLDKGPVNLHVEGSLLQVMLDEIDYLHKYEYWCSEQAASKLKALLLEQRIRQLLSEEFRHERDVKKLIKHLEKTQLESGQWSWWESGQPYLWISHHVNEALLAAKSAGYTTNYKQQQLVDDLVYRLERPGGQDKLRALEMLYSLEAKVEYPRYIAALEKLPKLSLENQFRLTRLRQQLSLPVQLDTLQKYKQHTMLGGVYWGEQKYSLFNNSISNTLLAYQILRAAGGHEQELIQVQAWLLNERRSGHWRNTYESAKVLETLLPDLLRGGKMLQETKLELSGALQANINSFPFDSTFNADKPLQIKKQGTQPLYFTAYQTTWVRNPQAVKKDFVVKTHFKGMGSAAVLEAGKPVELVVEVTARGDADFVMIEVPIPAGCSYGEKMQNGPNEVHREYFRHKTAIFCSSLKKGSYTFSIMLQPRFSGRYTLNPAKAELMYFPTFYGRDELKEVWIK
ncbi:carboxypeptidase-like regulatory domain-containing protein [Pontibacter anaerobius]|uniref:Carboxypeptidase-like regulatory domain-containing protein n=1 Tax=Pontibacter anaerobius TaxID=2993940 RepID=A0ABT3RK89_9BACT|nr:carboxypeptidase-like regulatory domain-containing protein [Pontibacter anaerobius]MCX2741789.1 carboxypeptidase-like regulatory domain-containing protein [Pontibacter anaerobius]